jgi:hypothetical protein
LTSTSSALTEIREGISVLTQASSENRTELDILVKHDVRSDNIEVVQDRLQGIE